MKGLALLGLLLPLAAAKVSYDGYKVFRVESHDSYEAIEKALADLSPITLSEEKQHKTFSVAISPDNLDAFDALGLDTTVLTEDLGAEFEKEGPFVKYEATVKPQGVKAAALPPVSYFNSYHSFDEHLQYLKDLQASFPGNSEVFSAGKSYEGREIRGIHLWGSAGKSKKPAIIWHGTVHAREWITAPTVEYLAYKIVEEYQGKDSVTVKTLDNYDFYILPVVNPDGFVYTNTDRLWRKNRQPRSTSTCIGTDVNRNWPFEWSGAGSSTSPCSETFRGLAAGDTPENKALVNHTQALANSNGIKFYIDWHSYSQLILLPYGYSCTAEAKNIDAQMKVAGGVASAIKGVNGLSFEYGPTCETIYQANGGSLDWVYAKAGAEYSWSIELRPGGSNSGGFVIPASNILPSGKEHWAGMKYAFSQF